ncbi:type I-E CRISPR-associated protein Cse2/CasB [Mesosutterella sp. AGMB02718]|uniref:Type I-E CRISPR-associated protein Cse2/CasB n=1 Tax=Mesosutterella faecium TaxID=2925194 RepID=A0ABT7ILW9_9BURK|nr:type I-E CRISPR-associated protein Cse2/CasB [Mesosutterella sp. AGMB02718]MDL2058995.1 type I-E CRISPR-associated protein Cse2/CasB [Mesosutterella sp. AGMB02718]
MEGKKSLQQQCEDTVKYLIKRISDKGIAADLRQADNPVTSYKAWPTLIRGGIDIRRPDRDAYFVIAAALARGKVQEDGTQNLGEALRASFDKDSENQGEPRLRRLLSCDTVDEACQIVRPIIHLIQSREKASLSYSRLLWDLKLFQSDAYRDRVKEIWAYSFYGEDTRKKEETKSNGS